jgi:hypothetical protein
MSANSLENVTILAHETQFEATKKTTTSLLDLVDSGTL